MTLEEALKESFYLVKRSRLSSAFNNWVSKAYTSDNRKIEEMLGENEDILFAARLSFSSNTFRANEVTFVVTTLRTIFYHEYDGRERMDQIPHDKVQTVKVSGSDVWSHLYIVGLSDTFHVEEKPPIIARLHEILNDLLYVHPQTAAQDAELPQDAEPAQDLSSDAADIAEALKSYKELLDTGIITQEEFDAKKRQLLNI